MKTSRGSHASWAGRWLALAACLVPAQMPAQQDLFSAPPMLQFGAPLLSDTLRDTAQAPSILIRAESRSKRGSFESTKSPALAVILSAVAPGVGQIYNESYWKAPVIWALGGYWVYEWTDLNNRYRDFRDQYNQSVEANPPFGNTQLQRVRDFYRDERDKFAWYLGALYFLNLLDAYVGAHLYDFNVSPDLGANGSTLPRATLTVRWTF